MEKQVRKEKYGGVVRLVSGFRTSVLYYRDSCMPGTDIPPLPSCHSVSRKWLLLLGDGPMLGSCSLG